MSLTRKIAHNTLYQIIGKGLSTVLGILAVGLMTRYLGQEGYGQYITVIAYLQFFGILVDMGLYIILLKKISVPDADERKIVSNIFTLRLISALIFLGLAPVIILFFPYPSIVKWGVLIASLSTLSITLNQVLIGVFQKKLKMHLVAIAEVLGKAVLLLLAFVAIGLKLNLLAILAAVALGGMANFLVTFALSRKFIHLRLAFDFVYWRQIMKESWPIAISIALNLIYFKADIILLSLFKPAADVGVYGAPYKILEVLITLPAMFAGLVTPLLTNAWAENNPEKFKSILSKSLNFMALIAFPMIVLTFFIAKDIMILIAGQDFAVSGPLLRILIIATASIFIGNLFGNTVVAIGQQKRMIKIYAAVAIIAVAGYLFFIPRYSYYGAAWMTVVSEVLICLGSVWLVITSTKIKPEMKTIGKIILAISLTALILLLLPNWYWLITLLLGGLIYLLFLYWFKVFTKQTVLEIIKLPERP
ncbi:flippase [Patescibacteria group bacterium]|nr:flippase [Patescibacteria group bacterium]